MTEHEHRKKDGKELFQAEEAEAKLRAHVIALEQELAVKTQELHRKDQELILSEERYHKMVDEVEDYAIILLDKEGVIQNWNKGAEKIKGYKEAEIVGKSFKTFYLPEDREKSIPDMLMEEAIEHGKALHEGWRLRKDKTKFWGSIVLTALHDEAGGLIGFTKVTRDLTERKIAEDKLTRYLQELEFQNKELEQFAYAASHDMKEPLRKIIFYNNFIHDSVAGQLPEKELTYLRRSIASAQRLHRLIDDLLTYSRASFRHEILEIVDLNEIVEDLLSAQKDVLDDKQATVIVDKLPVVRGISFQLRQLFDNLLTNALKYSHPDRTPRITITSKVVSVAAVNGAAAIPENTYYTISFADNGVGFDQDQEEKIFGLFQRLDTKTDASGTGLGLAICRRIVQHHKGFIKVTGVLNKGAVFMVYLPLQVLEE